jgi:ethanolamine utilization protein EutN
MQVGRVEGKAVSTVKHPSLKGFRLLIVQPLDLAGRPDGHPLLAIDTMGANTGDLVMLTTDGKGARQLVGAADSPARITVLGIIDEGVESIMVNQ